MNVVSPTEEQIRQRAYEIFLQHGCQPGRDMDNWRQAEYELMQLPVQKIAELESPKTKQGKPNKTSLASLVHGAIQLGAGKALPHFKR
ncbi:MAG TPA: DUF2934 domain-containing protein [Verrucomicrobiae bacterium]|nr:DUF2934 domain-containing protein [Verrucomicrobiae bacterium]